jgi:DNA-binding transcriptional MerR regulator
MYTVGKIAKQFGISRSTLLYYDRIGLLRPSSRSRSNYRFYHEQDIDRLKKIMLYREAGLPLGEVKKIIYGKSYNCEAKLALENRLEQINHEIGRLRSQQQIILKLLGDKEAIKRTRLITKESWVSLLKATGLSEEDMHKWHIEFELMAPDAHQDFLESLGFSQKKISEIRIWSQKK